MRDLERRVRLAKANVESMCTLMAGWSKIPLYKRKEDKHEPLLNLEVISSQIYEYSASMLQVSEPRTVVCLAWFRSFHL